MSENMQDEDQELNYANKPIIGYGLPYVGSTGKENEPGGAHVFNEIKSTQENICIGSLKISVAEASAINISGIAKVYPSDKNVYGFGPLSEEAIKEIYEFNVKFDLTKFKSAQEVYDTWKSNLEG
jgi:hypothetical protein